MKNLFLVCLLIGLIIKVGEEIIRLLVWSVFYFFKRNKKSSNKLKSENTWKSVNTIEIGQTVKKTILQDMRFFSLILMLFSFDSPKYVTNSPSTFGDKGLHMITDPAVLLRPVYYCVQYITLSSNKLFLHLSKCSLV